jgi:hypothetical protein
VTTRDRPSDRNETVMDIKVIWVRREGKYFCKRGWTDHFGKHEVICPSGKISSNSFAAAGFPSTTLADFGD